MQGKKKKKTLMGDDLGQWLTNRNKIHFRRFRRGIMRVKCGRIETLTNKKKTENE